MECSWSWQECWIQYSTLLAKVLFHEEIPANCPQHQIYYLMFVTHCPTPTVYHSLIARIQSLRRQALPGCGTIYCHNNSTTCSNVHFSVIVSNLSFSSSTKYEWSCTLVVVWNLLLSSSTKYEWLSTAMRAVPFSTVRRFPVKVMVLSSGESGWNVCRKLSGSQIMAQILSGVRRGTPKICCHTVTTKVSLPSSVSETVPAACILAGTCHVTSVIMSWCVRALICMMSIHSSSIEPRTCRKKVSNHVTLSPSVCLT